MSIQALYLDHNKIGDQGGLSLAKAMSQNQALNILYLNDNEMTNTSIIKFSHALEDNECLSNLYLFNNNVTDQLKLIFKQKHLDRVFVNSTLE